MENILALLTQRCFRRIWIIVIDNAELADKESMTVLKTVIIQNRILCLMSYGNKLLEPYTIPQELKAIAKVLKF